jgi:hypothetical protein
MTLSISSEYCLEFLRRLCRSTALIELYRIFSTVDFCGMLHLQYCPQKLGNTYYSTQSTYICNYRCFTGITKRKKYFRRRLLFVSNIYLKTLSSFLDATWAHSFNVVPADTWSGTELLSRTVDKAQLLRVCCIVSSPMHMNTND